MKLSILILSIFVGFTGLLFADGAVAGSNPRIEGEDTMTVVRENELPEVVDNEIQLPDSAAQQGVENSGESLGTANQAREKNREYGKERAQEAQQDQIRQQLREGTQDEVQDKVRERIRENISEQARERARERISE